MLPQCVLSIDQEIGRLPVEADIPIENDHGQEGAGRDQGGIFPAVIRRKVLTLCTVQGGTGSDVVDEQHTRYHDSAIPY